MLRQTKVRGWVDTCKKDIWVFIGIVAEMGVTRLPRISNCWICKEGQRFWALWAHFHVVDNVPI